MSHKICGSDLWSLGASIILWNKCGYRNCICGLVHFHACSHITEHVCPTSKKCLYAVHLTHTLCTRKAQLYFLRSQWHQRYFRCPGCDCGVCVFIVSHHFRDHLPDLFVMTFAIVGLVRSPRFPLQSFHLGLLCRFFTEPRRSFALSKQTLRPSALWILWCCSKHYTSFTLFPLQSTVQVQSVSRTSSLLQQQ